MSLDCAKVERKTEKSGQHTVTTRTWNGDKDDRRLHFVSGMSRAEVKEMTHEDEDVVQRCEASSLQVLAAERFPPTGLPPITHYFQETVGC